MKKILITMLFVLAVSVVFAQYEWENRGNVLAEPSVSYDLNRPIETVTITQPELAPEMEFSSGRQTVKIPFAYPFGNFVAAVNLPLQRITMASGEKSKSAIGLGDAVLSGSYRSYLPDGFNGWSLDYAADLTVKFPTGNREKTVKIDNVEYGTPMGTGSFDATLAANAVLGSLDREIFIDMKFRLNGEDADEVKNGNMFSLKGRYGLLEFEPKFDGYLGLQAVATGDGKIGNSDMETSMFLLDFVPELHYLTNLGMFKVGFSMPLLTSAKYKFTREYTVRFGISKKY